MSLAEQASPSRFLDHRSRPNGASASEATDAYYDAVNEFYLHGWGQSFHCAPRFAGETFHESLLRHEYYLAHRLGLESGMRVADLGCGVGGPMRNIARFAGVEVVGITINEQQVHLAERFNREAGLADRCRVLRGDFADLPFEDESFDAAFAMQSLCAAADRGAVLAEAFRVLRPGARFATAEWCMTDRHDPANPEHREIEQTLVDTIALPRLTPTSAVDDELRAAGFELLEARDLAGESDPQTPWYRPLTRREGGLLGFGASPAGRMATQGITRVMESLGRAPRGSAEAHKVLMRSADALARSGELGIFTPVYFALARKP